MLIKDIKYTKYNKKLYVNYMCVEGWEILKNLWDEF